MPPYALVDDLAEVWIAPGQYIDLSIESNRRKFITAGSKPVELGALTTAATSPSD